ncbi:hypothetical protein [Luteibacter sp.]|uniref:hypothetical protein n=1 Tax=Luteibacter sp. TaxID=1886636 RepID=UPI0028078D10|nr:hypothetical protein [Luteibacter sp.]MDQ8050690.1 hypothetical protein [Luteibacter sp.]
MSRRWAEVAYIVIGLRGLQAEIEFPSDWHERNAGWVRICLGFITVAFSFPWPWVVDDEHQCSGPTYGFNFFEDGLHLHWGKQRGRRDDPFTVIGMPWRWRHQNAEHKKLGEPETHPYTYTLRSGDVQHRTATIQAETRTWLRPWLPYKLVRKAIDIEFDAEVGERTGSWKGGCVGCSYEMSPGEAPVDTLRRMERERKF